VFAQIRFDGVSHIWNEAATKADSAMIATEPLPGGKLDRYLDHNVTIPVATEVYAISR
jgi:hypothetical protein